MLYKLLLTGFIIMLLAACTSPVDKDGAEKTGVVVTILPQKEFVSRVGGDKIDVTVMVPPGANPHTYEVTPAQMVKLSRARIYFKVGSPIEFELAWLDKLIAANKGMTVVDCSKGVELIQSDDPDEPGADAHIWTSPRNIKIMAGNICAGLSAADPANREYYEKNLDKYIVELDKLDADIAGALKGYANRAFIVYHPAWGYFARDYGLKQTCIEQGGKEPQAAYLARLITEARAQNIKIIFVSPAFDTRSAEAVAREIGGRTVIVDNLAGNYLENMRRVAAAFSEAVK
jgi:zinc transport system substrate-binding protein